MYTRSARAKLDVTVQDSHLIALPDDLLIRIATLGARSACALREAHPNLARTLRPLVSEWDLQSMYRFQSASSGMGISTNNNLSLHAKDPHGWASAGRLPSWGRHEWSICVEETQGDQQGAMLVGVSNGKHGWGLIPLYGEVCGHITSHCLITTLNRPKTRSSPPSACPRSQTHPISRPRVSLVARPRVCACASASTLTNCVQIWRAVWKPAIWKSRAGRVEYALAADKPAPPPGFPAISRERSFRGLEHANSPARGLVIDIVYDVDEGMLSFAMTYQSRREGFVKTVHEPMRQAVVDFPKGARMRPWVHLCNVGDVLRVDLQRTARST